MDQVQLSHRLGKALLEKKAKNTNLLEADYQKCIEEEKERCFLYIGDDLGFLKVWDLTYIVKRLGFNKAKNHPKSKVSFNPKRKENIDISSFANQMRKEA
mmetsp:Transcript_1193/g.1211  ORF Transcript_1193/g.1211 Transcript_1193/m.1211 type:complete len:100 (+) Transcript_1193:2198-2497(+)